MTTIENFIKNYTKELLEDNAAIFVGAGLSVSSGYVNWRDLLRDIANDLKLDIDRENDLIAIAQYHVNEKKNRGQINQKIIEQFTADARKTDVHDIIARLPIKTFWTTNYDTLIEDSLKENHKKADTKIDAKSLANNIPKRDAIVYKMHGDISLPSDAVITKDDYEVYNEKRQLFTTALQGDLITKTFLFIGFSFEDPNLSYILSRIRILIGENKRPHYAFFKKVNPQSFSSDTEYKYAEIKQKFMIDDLQRYAIEAVMLDNYDEIPKILGQIEQKLNIRNVFISGSAYQYSDWSQQLAVNLIQELTAKLILNECKVFSGFGLGVGSFVINSAVQTINEKKYRHYDDYLEINPFPFQLTGDERQKFNTLYRDRILECCGIALFLFGNKMKDGKLVTADGVLEEFKIAKEKGLCVIPIGSTGYAASEIANIIKADIKNYKYLQDKIGVLCSSKDINDIINAVISIIKGIIGG
jgi:NAD-dependent SIR2 family protein deacetylase